MSVTERSPEHVGHARFPLWNAAESQKSSRRSRSDRRDDHDESHILASTTLALAVGEAGRSRRGRP